MTRHLLAAPDKFRGTARAAEVAEAIADAAVEHGWSCDLAPISDGGEGVLDCFGGPNQQTVVYGPLSEPVTAGWRLDGARAVIEMATASGLALVAGRNDPIAADTTGTAELIIAALEAGARQIIVGVGGAASTDGGLAAVRLLRDYAPLPVTVAADVTATFIDAARTFAPQKGATAEQVDALTQRLTDLAQFYDAELGIDVTAVAGSGAAGGLAGGLYALGAAIRPGFDVVAEELGLDRRIAAANLVITGEGRLDATSMLGKAPVALARRCGAADVPIALVVGEMPDPVDLQATVFDLTASFGAEAARGNTLDCIRAAVATLLADHPG